MSYLQLLEPVYKIIVALSGALSLYIGISKIIKTRKSTIKRNASAKKRS